VITAFLLGFMGSLHCAGMCGPLILMTPVVGASRVSIAASRMTYHTGRIGIYSVLGSLFGLIGESIALAGFQRWLSAASGLIIILALIAANPAKKNFLQMPAFLKSRFAAFLRQRSYVSILALGAINGLLPCGLVYVAATASVAAGGILESIVYMLLFGVGTLPMLLGVSLLRRRIPFLQVRNVQRLAPFSVATVAILLIIRADPISLLRGGSGPALCPACVR
jgi:uncharacterized protein